MLAVVCRHSRALHSRALRALTSSPRAAHPGPGRPAVPRPRAPDPPRRAARAMAAPVVEAGGLRGLEDNYDGVIIDPDSLPSASRSEEFSAGLATALEAWRAAGKRGVWLRVPLAKAALVGPAAAAGFEFHHAERDYVMMTCWLPEAEENKLPPGASHQVGVGAFVLNDKQEVLVVQERHGPLRGTGVWKMPTGLVQAGEDISEAAVREVQEETGVRARFDAVLSMRQAHGFAFGKSDFFFVVALKLEPGPQELVVQEDELVGVRWMPLAEYLDMPFTRSRPLLRKIAQQCAAYAAGTYAGLAGRKLAMGKDSRSDLLIFGEVPGDEERSAEDMWIGLDGPAAHGDGASGGSGSGSAAAARLG